MNIYDISKKAGVSIATVSRVLNGSENVSDKTRQTVLSVIKESGYTPNIFARGLLLNTMNTIGILCADSSDIYLASAVYHLEHELRAHHYDSILCCTGYETRDKQNALHLLLSKRVDAVILVGSSYIENTKKQNQYIVDAASSVPIIIVNGHLDGQNIYSAVCDDYHATYEAAKSFIGQGRSHFLFLYRSLSYSGKQKIKGFKDALKDHGIPFHDSMLLHCPSDIDAAKDLLLVHRKEYSQINAILASDDELAISALKFAKFIQRKVPEDIAILGYNNSRLCQCCDPELSSIDNKAALVCKHAVDTLMHILSGKSVPNKTTVPADIVYRQTALDPHYNFSTEQ